jgi:hypothetical protein
MTHQLHGIDLYFISVLRPLINSEIMSDLETPLDFLDVGLAHCSSIGIPRYHRRIKTKRACSDPTR